MEFGRSARGDTTRFVRHRLTGARRFERGKDTRPRGRCRDARRSLAAGRPEAWRRHRRPVRAQAPAGGEGSPMRQHGAIPEARNIRHPAPLDGGRTDAAVWRRIKGRRHHVSSMCHRAAAVLRPFRGPWSMATARQPRPPRRPGRRNSQGRRFPRRTTAAADCSFCRTTSDSRPYGRLDRSRQEWPETPETPSAGL